VTVPVIVYGMLNVVFQLRRGGRANRNEGSEGRQPGRTLYYLTSSCNQTPWAQFPRNLLPSEGENGPTPPVSRYDKPSDIRSSNINSFYYALPAFLVKKKRRSKLCFMRASSETGAEICRPAVIICCRSAHKANFGKPKFRAGQSGALCVSGIYFGGYEFSTEKRHDEKNSSCDLLHLSLARELFAAQAITARKRNGKRDPENRRLKVAGLPEGAARSLSNLIIAV